MEVTKKKPTFLAIACHQKEDPYYSMMMMMIAPNSRARKGETKR